MTRSFTPRTIHRVPLYARTQKPASSNHLRPTPMREKPSPIQSPQDHPPQLSSFKPFAVFMDAGPMYFASRDYLEDAQIDYAALWDLIARKALKNSQAAMRVMWSTVSPGNAGQLRFIEYAEGKLGWTVRRFFPTDGYLVDPTTLAGIAEARLRNRLIRFDASIGYAIGSVASTHRIVLITDSFGLAEPLVRAARAAADTNYLMFFGRLLDPRWHSLLRDDPITVQFIDLDEHEEVLSNRRPARDLVQSAWSDEFLLGEWR